jgi:peptidoglycan/xylan/chitin deacetylase (PgdA/CDA1 family)
MPALQFDAFPQGKRRALIMSYDDGRTGDRRLVETLNRFHMRGTFHLFTDVLGNTGFVEPGEVKALYEGHEVSGHSHTHPHLPHLSNEGVMRELLRSRKILERLVEYPVRGFAYPGGGFDDRIVSLLPAAGVEYARTTLLADSFLLTGDLLRLPMSCHHSTAMAKLAEWKATPARWSTQVFLVMGHSFEFDNGETWGLFEEFCRAASGDPAVWYTTTIELIDYMKATRLMCCSVDGRLAHNPTAIPVWATAPGEKIVCIEPGQTWRAR